MATERAGERHAPNLSVLRVFTDDACAGCSLACSTQRFSDHRLRDDPKRDCGVQTVLDPLLPNDITRALEGGAQVEQWLAE